MVENFVEKYIPVRIQSQISETLQQVLPYKETQTLAAYEKLRFGEMHQIILDDDGYPNLFEKFKQIRFDIGKIDVNNYQGIKVAKVKPACLEEVPEEKTGAEPVAKSSSHPGDAEGGRGQSEQNDRGGSEEPPQQEGAFGIGSGARGPSLPEPRLTVPKEKE